MIIELNRRSIPVFSLCLLSLASCGFMVDDRGGGQSVENGENVASPFVREEVARFDEPWAMAFEPGTGTLFVTEKRGELRFVRPDGTKGSVTGVPAVAYGGQGGLGDIAFAPGYAPGGHVYLSWAEAGEGNVRGAAVARANLICDDGNTCALRDLGIIWRQQPKVSGHGHYSHRLAFSPDGQFLFVASGERQKQQPAQDTGNTLGTIVRLTPDGEPAPGNPMATRPSPTNEIWSWGHRNILGLEFAPDGRLWEIEHGPRGGDELNLVEKGANYGWPIVSNGSHYSGQAIPDHATRPEFAAPALSWSPVIAPGDMAFYTGSLFPAWQGQLLIAGLKSQAIVRVAIDGESAREVGRYGFNRRLRAIVEGPDDAVYIAADGRDAPVWRLTPAK